MGVSWGTIKSLTLFFGPILIPKAISYYRSVRAQPAIRGVSIIPTPPAVSRALTILFISSICYITLTLPFLSPENIFRLTESRLQIPTDVLFTRLASLRSNGLTPNDELLRTKLNSLDSRLLYFQYGPEVLSTCLFCTSEDPRSYLYYALPSIASPHLFNLIILATVTSGLFTGNKGSSWRTTATFASAGLMLADMWFVSAYDSKRNARATRIQDIDAFYLRSRIYRLTLLAFLNALLGWVLYLSSTNRFFVKPPTANERIESTTKALEEVRVKMSAVGILKNTVLRDAELRRRCDEYWSSEVRIVSEAMEDGGVVESVNNALENRLNLKAIGDDAEMYAGHVVAPLLAQFDAASNGSIPI